jgi:hypothetical protein
MPNFKNHATYDRPINARLIVRLDNGDEWEADEEDLQKFGFLNGHNAYIRWERHISGLLREAGLLGNGDITDTEINAFRYITELILCYPEDFLSHADGEINKEVVDIERNLRSVVERSSNE